MALNLAHQLGALCGTPMVTEAGATTVAEPSSAPVAIWKPQAAASGQGQQCWVQRAELDQISPPLGPGIRRPDLSVACKALVENAQAATAPEAVEVVKEHVLGGTGEKEIGVPVYVMLPLDTVKEGGKGLNRRKAMNASLMALKSAGVTGVMVDVWWGLVEKERPGEYDWRGYDELLEMASRIGLKVQAVMSFHQCGGNVGDCVTIPLPTWVVEEMDKDPDLAYTDPWGRRNYEYVSLGCDTLPVLKGRTPVQCYADFMRAFRDHFRPLLGTTIVEIQVGMGPAGELRYPSYPELNGTWRFPGIGAFQCYDRYMLSSLMAAAEAAGKPEWGHGGPTDAGGYNSWPEDTAFFRREGGWNSPYGEFFLSWYSQMLIEHGERIVSSANSVFDSTGVKISIKVAGIHWHYGTRSHAPELTAGYYNTRFHNGYLPIARMMGRHHAVFNFTCVEMRNHEQPEDAMCRPEDLVRQVAETTKEAGVPLAGENALPRYDDTAHQQITSTAMAGESNDNMVAFTYLRMGPDLFQPENWQKFVAFVKKMSEGSEAERRQCREQLERETEPSVYISWPPAKEATAARQ